MTQAEFDAFLDAVERRQAYIKGVLREHPGMTFRELAAYLREHGKGAA